eukprot:scaffold49379_cov52-Phaeocystis_antarctica.AAC.4
MCASTRYAPTGPDSGRCLATLAHCLLSCGCPPDGLESKFDAPELSCRRIRCAVRSHSRPAPTTTHAVLVQLSRLQSYTLPLGPSPSLALSSAHVGPPTAASCVGS